MNFKKKGVEGMMYFSRIKQGSFITFLLALFFFSSYAVDTNDTYHPGKILVTGGAGFIGSTLVEKLLQEGREVVVIDNFCDYYNPTFKERNLQEIQASDINKKLTFYLADICDMRKLKNIFEQEKPTTVCHLAGCGGVRPSIENPQFYLLVNVVGTQNMLDCAKMYGVKHFVFASSSSVYGKSSIPPFIETDPADQPCSPYAASKRTGELLAHVYHHLYGFSCTCLRFFTVYGPRGRPDMAPFKFLDAVHNNRPITQFGDGSSKRDFTYVDDIVDGIIAALYRPLGFEIINLGRSHTITLAEFIATIEEVVGKKAIINKIDDQAGDVPLTFANIDKAHRLLNYKPKVSPKEGLTRMYAWYTRVKDTFQAASYFPKYRHLSEFFHRSTPSSVVE